MGWHFVNFGTVIIVFVCAHFFDSSLLLTNKNRFCKCTHPLQNWIMSISFSWNLESRCDDTVSLQGRDENVENPEKDKDASGDFLDLRVAAQLAACDWAATHH